MTNREFYEAVANGTNNNEVREFAEKMIVKMDERNEKHRNEKSKKEIENEPIKEKIVEFLNEKNESCVASAIAEFLEISTQKTSALCRQLVESGKLEATEVKIPKQGKRKVYKIKRK